MTEQIKDAVAFALAHESQMDRDIGKALEQGHFGEPWPIGQTIGPVTPRSEPSGLILRDGEILAEWGDVERVDMTFSISKSYLALLAGIAVEDGLIPQINAPVGEVVDAREFAGPNAAVTWAHLLQLTSEWQGTLWDKPDWIDHYRSLDGAERPPIGTKRPLQAPGSYWEYNDVRVNALALALLYAFRRPLPEVLAERVMAPIGASGTWSWHGYSNSYVEIGGQRMQSVSGGAHWGGGLWISAADHARVGQLMAQRGRWKKEQVLARGWVDVLRTPCPLNPRYGALWWLNSDGTRLPGLPRDSFFALGVGTQAIFVAPTEQVVVVVRWIEDAALAPFLSRVMGALAA